jgi:hypothetical protein
LELNSLIEQQKVKQQAAEQELDRLREKLNRDIETMHKDMAFNHFNTKSSFVQEDGKDLVTRAKEAILNIAAAAKRFTTGSSEAETKVTETKASEPATPAAETTSTDEKKVEVAKEESKEAEKTEVEAPAAEATEASFVQMKAKGAAEAALDKAQDDLRKLQAKMRAQTASLAQFRKH